MTLAMMMFITIMASAQMLDPVHFTTQLKTNKGAEGEIVFAGKIDKGWHVYSTALGADGPISATFNVNKLSGVELVGKLQPRGNEIKKYDKLFEMTLRYFEHSVTFVQKIKFTKPNYSIDAYLEYGACSNMNCMPPTSVEFKKSGKSNISVTEPSSISSASGREDVPSTNSSPEETSVDSLSTSPISEVNGLKEMPVGKESAVDNSLLWRPVIKQLQQFGGNNDIVNHSLWYIFLMGIVGGLLALVMPCIWPIIPMTVSFFLKRSKDNRQRGVREATTYGISIIVIYLALGIGITAIFGSSTLNALSTNAVFNIFLFLLLIVFALSFFGWFEIKLPDSWANKVDTKAGNTTGLISIFLMAFTLVLVSFSCTAPIVGLLLVQTVTSGDWLAPAVGMFGFALALAVPFSLFAMFPTLMKKSPKSGAWMDQIKVVLGFIELAFSLKFFSVADLAYGWHIMDREVFLALWIVIFGALGAYLVGWLKFQQDAIGGDLHKPMPVPAIMLGLCSFAFAIYMIPGLWGAPCKAVSAFAPPITTQDFNLNNKVVVAKYNDYEEGMAAAKAAGKPVLLDFTGYGCVNCRKMEASVWTDPRVADKLTNDYVLISLYGDDKTKLPKPLEVKGADGNVKTLRTIGDKWSYLQAYKFGANIQPFYVILDNNGNPLAAPYSYNEDISAYLDFLDKGLDAYRNKRLK